MADGKGCICGAYGPSECACDVDWRPQALLDAIAEQGRLRDEIDRLKNIIGFVRINKTGAALTEAERGVLLTAVAAVSYAADELGLSSTETDQMIGVLRTLRERLS